jgi:hypothetical protein
VGESCDNSAFGWTVGVGNRAFRPCGIGHILDVLCAARAIGYEHPKSGQRYLPPGKGSQIELQVGLPCGRRVRPKVGAAAKVIVGQIASDVGIVDWIETN